MTITDSRAELWFRRFRPAPDAVTRLLCFPHAGGAASYYYPLCAELPPEVELVAVQYPGRQERRSEPLIPDIGRLADQLADVVPALADRPLAFFGHSMGATVAYEVALRLERRPGAVGPDLLFASGRRAPSRVREDRVHLHGDAALLAELRKLSGTDARVLDDPELVRLVLPAVRNDYRAIETYRCAPGRPRLRCPVTVLIGDSDPQVNPDEAAAWSEHTDGGATVRVLPGGHFYLARQLPRVAEIVADGLAPRTPAGTEWSLPEAA